MPCTLPKDTVHQFSDFVNNNNSLVTLTCHSSEVADAPSVNRIYQVSPGEICCRAEAKVGGYRKHKLQELTWHSIAFQVENYKPF